MSSRTNPPETTEALHAAILEAYEGLSKRLQQIARYALDEPAAMALETLAVLAERCAVQPSAIVRFAKAFGYEGATQMQRVFRDGLLSSGGASLGYGERVRQFSHNIDGKRVDDPQQLLAEFVDGNVMAMQNLADAVGRKELNAAVKLLAEAETVYVVGFRRSFPVAAYLAYSLHQVDKRTVFIDNVGGLARQQLHAISRNDLLVAVSFHPYAEEVVDLIDAAVEQRCKVLSISDSLVSPVAKPATVVLQVREAEIRNFRSLSASMCLAQALVISYAFASNVNTRNRSTFTGKSRRKK
ncbi:MAG TPA: MurR/RpiR family transcriptional regulator [Rhodanobacteraceae bacterium]|nr:MurR/RpiR family transcriptional regulator [Rhodanobacteraceae bacterium]